MGEDGTGEMEKMEGYLLCKRVLKVVTINYSAVLQIFDGRVMTIAITKRSDSRPYLREHSICVIKKRAFGIRRA